MPEGFENVIYPLNGKISFFKKLVGISCDNMMPANEVVLLKVVCVIRGRPGGIETDVKIG